MKLWLNTAKRDDCGNKTGYKAEQQI